MSIVPLDYDYERRRSSAMLPDNPEYTVLVQDQQHHNIRLIPYGGMEEEDFMMVLRRLHDYIGVKNIKDDTQKLAILRSILHNGARLEFETKYPDITASTVKFKDVCDAMQAKYTTDKSKLAKEEAFESARQLPGENPSMFLTRLKELAYRASMDLKDDDLRISRRFRFGLLPEYLQHCQRMGAETQAEFYKYSTGLWKSYYSPVQQSTIPTYAVPSVTSSTEAVKSVSFHEGAKPVATKADPTPPAFNEDKLREMMKKVMEDTLDRKVSKALNTSNKKIEELQATTKKLEETTDKKIKEVLKANEKKQKETTYYVGPPRQYGPPRQPYGGPPSNFYGPPRQQYGPPRQPYGGSQQNYYGQPYGPPRPVGPPGTNGSPSSYQNNGTRAIAPPPPQGPQGPNAQFQYYEDAYNDYEGYYYHEYPIMDYEPEYYPQPPASVTSSTSKN